MVEVDEEEEDQGVHFAAGADDFKVPGEDDEPDMDEYGEEEELVPMKAGHGGLFGADLGNMKY